MRKFRGSSTLRGTHAFDIGPGGITIYPRLEAARRQSPGDAVQTVPVSSGVAGLDAMFDLGGYAKGSVTAVTGPSGSGKTTLGLHFLARASAQGKGLFLGFYESPELLARMAEIAGIASRQELEADHIQFLWHPFGENMLYALAAQLLQLVESFGVGRVIIDGVGGFMATPAYPERGGPFFGALMNELRRLGATTLVTVEENDVQGGRMVDTPTMSALADTVVQLSVREEESVRRFASIRKSRVSRYDPRVREVMLTAAGLDVVHGELPIAP